MIRARAWAANLLLAAARRLVGERDLPLEEEDDGALPAGHPAVALSSRAREMVRAGAASSHVPTCAKETEVLRGSLRSRFDARRNP